MYYEERELVCIYIYIKTAVAKEKLNYIRMLAFQLLGGAKGEKRRNPFHLVLLSFFSLLLCSWHRYVVLQFLFSFAQCRTIERAISDRYFLINRLELYILHLYRPFSLFFVFYFFLLCRECRPSVLNKMQTGKKLQKKRGAKRWISHKPGQRKRERQKAASLRKMRRHKTDRERARESKGLELDQAHEWPSEARVTGCRFRRLFVLRFQSFSCSSC